MTVYFHETRKTIDFLRRVVDKLDEHNGCISAEELWDGVECVPANVRSSDPTVARHGMREMEGFSDVLQSFTSTLVSTYKSHTSTTRRRAQIPKLTITGLPNEIIHNIVKNTLDYNQPLSFYVFGYNRSLSLVKYSHICSKTRYVILDSPSLWTPIPLTLKMSTNLIAAIIRRSAASNLIVDINESFAGRSPRCSSVQSKFSILFEHLHRWREVTLSVNIEFEKFVQEHYPRANLASVRVLRVKQWKANFIDKWDIPQLEELEWSSAIRPPPPSIASEMLHTCTLTLEAEATNSTSILAFLNAATSLRSLQVELKYLADSATKELPEIRLSCLEHLGIQFRSGDGPTASRLLKSILCPGLKRLTISASTLAEYSDLTENMRKRYPMLTAFTLYAAGDFFFDDVMCPLPNTIKELKILPIYQDASKLSASRRDDIVPQNFGVFFPNLTYLDLLRCTIQEEDFFDKLSEVLGCFHVSLDHFYPAKRRKLGKATVELEAKNAIMTLQRAGVLTI